MKRHKSGEWWAAALCVLPVVLLMSGDAQANPGGFWYGLWGVHPTGLWGADVCDSMRTRFRMNFMVSAMYDQTWLNEISSHGIRTISLPDLPFTDNLIFRYSASEYLRYEAEHDTIAWQWQPNRTGPGSADGTIVKKSGGGVVADPLADNGYALSFYPGMHPPNSKVWAHVCMFRGRGQDIHVAIQFRYRSIPRPSSSAVLAYFGLRDDLTPGVSHYRDSVMVAETTDRNYRPREFVFSIADANFSEENWFNVLYIEWTGAESLWVDWIQDSEVDGRRVVDTASHASIRQFIQQQSFNLNPTIIGFWMDEERPEDANVIPHYLVDSLIKSVDTRLQGYTQNHQLWRWNNTPGTPYGGRVAASARLQKASHVTNLSYPFAGYNPYQQELTPEGLRTVPSLACVANPPPTCAQVGSDTSVCFQVVMDREGQALRHYKRFCDSIGARFVPFMQGFSGQERPIPVDCSSDTSWYGGARPPTKGEAKCHAGVALANGVNGLVYFRYAGYQQSVKIKLPCHQDSIVFYTLRADGLNTMPELQAALRDYVGPFVDSLGHLFADFIWRGGGRVDPHSDSAGLATIFDSVRSLTFTAPDDSAYIEAGVYELAGSDYFMLVNRRAYEATPQTIRVYMPIDSAAYIIDQYSRDTIYVSTCTGHGAFNVTLPPGEGKLFKIAPASKGLSTPNLSLRHSTDGTSYDDRYGWAVSSVGDVDADGTPDYAVGAPWADPNGVTDAGLVYVYSGRTGQLLECVRGMQAGAGLGSSICALGDVNGDGYDDFVAGAPGWDEGGVGADVGWVGIISGYNTTALHYWAGTGNYDSLGVSVAGVGDLGTDGKADFIAGAPGWDNYGTKVDVGAVYVCSGAGSPLGPPSGGALAGDHFGYSVAAADVDGNGRKEFVIGAPFADNGPTGADAGAVFVGRWRRNGDGPGARLGWSVACAGDIHGDGNEDIAVGAPYTIPSGGLDSAGVAYVFPGEVTYAAASMEDPSADYIYRKTGSSIGDRLGWSVAGAGDVSGDCRGDFCIGAPGVSAGGGTNSGATYIYSGNGGTQLNRIDGQFSGDELGRSVAAAVRPFGQLAAYVVSGMPFADRGGNGDVGSATVAGLESSCDCPNQGDVINNDLAVDVFDVIQEIAIAFSGGADIQDPGCPTTRGDVEYDGGVDVFDVMREINIAYSGGTPDNPCGP